MTSEKVYDAMKEVTTLVSEMQNVVTANDLAAIRDPDGAKGPVIASTPKRNRKRLRRRDVVHQ